MALEDKKSYYAIIPASVRYDTRLCANSKLLYGEITALCNEKGYCWASNKYFADLYNVSKTSISKWISALERTGYINIRFKYKENTNEIEYRYIYIIPTNINNIQNNNSISSQNDDLNNTQKSSNEKYKHEIEEIIDYLNKKTGCRYRYNTESTNKLIRSKLNNGFSVQDFKIVIDNKVIDWKNTEFEKYLRPYTLFGNKFEQYLNQMCNRRFDSIHVSDQQENETVNNSTEFLRNNKGNLITY